MRMTIDKAIARARKRSNKNSDCWKHCIAAGYCERCEKEHEQLVEWLEELKDLREKKKVFEKQGYNKAIDDYNEALADDLTWLMNYGEEVYINVGDDANRIAEQLKEQTYE